jgi:uncharacterized protein
MPPPSSSARVVFSYLLRAPHPLINDRPPRSRQAWRFFACAIMACALAAAEGNAESPEVTRLLLAVEEEAVSDSGPRGRAEPEAEAVPAVAAAVAAEPAPEAPDEQPQDGAELEARTSPGMLEPEADPAAPEEAATAEPLAERSGPIAIGGITVQPGTRAEFRLQTSEDFTAGNVEAWGLVVHGTRPGPVLCLIGGIHGDELNGVEIVRRVVETESPAGLSGTLVGVPIVNVSGFTNQNRYLPDRRDLNRYFPGRANGSIASRIAWELWSRVIVHCTHLIDLHTGSHNRTNLPQIRGDLNNPIVLDMARAFDSRVAIHNPGLDGTLRSAASRAGIAAVLYEAGETLRFQEHEIQMGVSGVRNVMRALGMKRGRQGSRGPQYLFRETRWLRADRGGILELHVKPGDMVAAGEVVGVISDPLRRTSNDLVSKRKGRVIGIALLPMVSPGTAVVHMGIPGSSVASAELDDELDRERPE